MQASLSEWKFFYRWHRLPEKEHKTMNIKNPSPRGEQKMRIVQELVPGKQVTLAHVITHQVQSLLFTGSWA